ncbi:hypothetical protein FF100_33945 [Methylobacterium terricola]|uniref:Alpha 1,4-glycosyltransferase domain-containing protein n=1 Tax=Methylobacterium terricola TaxID=2583531 RepID=A0A5C4L6R2_9HYPH|nr:hypothetical protein [Methylobacterium terricola]TNC06819.1 hypothetical protein FF100_33945 [Methylobacterium terricola]
MAIFRTFFHGKTSPYEITCLKSFVDYGHTVVFYSYDKRSCPSFCEWVDAEKIIPLSSIFYYETGEGAGSIAAFADCFRYLVLYESGDWWVDTDVLCLSSSWPDDQIVAGWESQKFINNAIMKFERGNPILEEMSAICLEKKGQATWGENGPRLLTSTLKKYFAIDNILPQNAFYAIEYLDATNFIDPDFTEEITEKTKCSLAAHLWNEMLRREAINKFVLPKEGSFFRNMAKKHDTISYFHDAS